MAITSPTIPSASGLSIGFRCLAVLMGGACLVQEAWTNIQTSGVSWSNPNPAVLGAALLSFMAAVAWPFAEKAYRERAWVHMVCLMVGFCFATGACLVNGITVQSRDVDTRSGIAAGSKVAFDAAQAAKAAAEAEVVRLTPLVAQECVRRGPQCKLQTEAIDKAKAEVERQTTLVQAAIAGLEQIGPEHRIATLFGLSTSDQRVTIWRPVLQPIALCLFGIGFLGMALRDGRAVARPAMAETVAAPVLAVDNTDKQDRELAELIRALQGVNRPISNAELARRMDCSPGEASKRVTKYAHLVTRVQDGKAKAIRLVG